MIVKYAEKFGWALSTESLRVEIKLTFIYTVAMVTTEWCTTTCILTTGWTLFSQFYLSWTELLSVAYTDQMYLLSPTRALKDTWSSDSNLGKSPALFFYPPPDFGGIAVDHFLPVSWRQCSQKNRLIFHKMWSSFI